MTQVGVWRPLSAVNKTYRNIWSRRMSCSFTTFTEVCVCVWLSVKNQRKQEEISERERLNLREREPTRGQHWQRSLEPEASTGRGSWKEQEGHTRLLCPLILS